jgi:hypothetical protein
MLNRIALKLSVLCCAFLITTAVVAAPRHQKADDGSNESSVSKSQGPGRAFSLQRLLTERIRLTRDILRTLRALEATEEPEPGIGTLVVVDGPDPFSLTGPEPKPEEGEGSDDTQDRRRKERDSLNSVSQPYQSLH